MPGYSVTFSIVDEATAKIEAINKRIAAVRAPIERLQRSTQKMIDSSGLSKIADGFLSIGRSALAAVASVSRLALAIGGITAAATLAGIAKLVTSFSDLSAELSHTATGLNTSSQNLQAFQNAIKLAGGNVDDMVASLKGLAQASYGAILGRDPIAAQTFARAGIALKDANGHLRDATELLPEAIKYVSSFALAQDRAAIATQLGDRHIADLAEDFRRSGKPFEVWLKQAREAGTVSEVNQKSLLEYRQALGKMSVAFENLGYSVTAAIGGAVTPLLKDLADWVTEHRGDIAGFIQRVADGFKKWYDDGGLQDLGTFLKAIGTAIKFIGDNADKAVTGIRIFARTLENMIPGLNLFMNAYRLLYPDAAPATGGGGTGAGAATPGGGGTGSSARGGFGGGTPIPGRGGATGMSVPIPGAGGGGAPTGPGGATGPLGAEGFPANWAPDMSAPQLVESKQEISHPERNNPGNLRVGPNDWQGKVTPPGAAFEHFQTMEQGIRARAMTYMSYLRRGVNTLATIAATSGPASDNNDIPSQIAAYKRALGGKYAAEGGENLPVEMTGENIRRLTAAGISIEAGGGGKWLPKGVPQARIDAVLQAMSREPRGSGGAGGVNADLHAATSEAWKSVLPPGWSAKRTPHGGVRPGDPGQHGVGNAEDWQLYDDKGNPIRNRGEDTTGLYRKWAVESLARLMVSNPALARNFVWGQHFGTEKGGGGEDDIMHVDVGGVRGRRGDPLSEHRDAAVRARQLQAEAAIRSQQLRATGPPAQAAGTPQQITPAGNGAANGAVDVTITHKNPPPGASATASGSGAGVTVAPVRTEYADMSAI